ncbi:MAG TPA: tetratricopeptide repeat protein [Anaeromyxobacter sp.]|nr:tetratricopeptide repeat protein [Anaeromyxobacter sp.]
MGPPGKQLSPAEISALEHAFATDPASDAYRPLTEAYLAAGRFMEAMVVCKKGVKAHPDDPSARVLLARVYADQGKDRKALEELGGVLAAFPTFVAANRLAATLHFRLGEREPGEAALRRAAEAAPNDPDVLELLQKHGVKLAAPAAPGRPRTGPDAPPVAPRVLPGGRAAPAAQPDVPERSIEVPIPTPVPSRRARDVAYAQALADKYGTSQYEIARGAHPKKKSHRTMLVGSLGLALALAAALGGWSWKTRADAERARAIDALLKDVREQVEKDTYPAYLAAAKGAAEILEHDSTNVGGHAYLAYVDALRWAEHGDGEAARGSAVQHLNRMLEVGRTHSHLYAAEAYLRAAGGDPAGAREGIEKAFAANPATQTPFLSAVLGAVQLRAGELDAAAATLKSAQEKGPGDARTAWLLAEQFRRRGEGYEAQAVNYYDYALRIQKDHVSSILGRAIVLLGRGQLEEASKAAELVLAPQTGASKPQLALARAIRGGVLAARGKLDAAAAEESEAAKLDPANPDLPWLAGVRKLRAGDAAGAVEQFQRAIALDNKRVSLYADLTRAMLRKDGGVPQALETLKRTVARLGESPRLSLLLGDAYRAAGDLDLARGNYKKAIELGRPFPDARVALARLYRAQNDIPSALVELTTAIDEYGAGGTGGVAAAYVEMAEAERARAAKPEKLKELYDKALEKDPASCEALWGAARARAELPKLKDAAEQRTQLLERYVRACPAAANAAEARGILGVK